MTGKFVLRSSPKTGLVFELDETLPESDIEAMLSFSDDQIEEMLHTHAANQAYWEAFALRLKGKLNDYKDVWQKKWWARNKRYAKDVLISYGDTKPTIDSLNDMVINIYGEGTTEGQKEQFMLSGYSAANKRTAFNLSQEDYHKDMFAFLSMDPPWTYEAIVRTENRLSEDYEIVRIVAERLNAKSFHMKEVIGLIQAYEANTGVTVRNERRLMRSSSAER